MRERGGQSQPSSASSSAGRSPLASLSQSRPTGRRGTPVLNRRVSLYVAALTAGVAWFPRLALVPSSLPDQSWRAGLVMARVQRLQFGPDIAFTYGPLGFLAHPTLWGGPSLLAIAAAVVVLLSQVIVLARWFSFRIPAFGAAILAGLLVRASWTFEQSIATPLVLLLFATGLAAVLEDRVVPVRWCGSVGAAGGLLLLMKLDAVVVVGLAMIGISSAGLPALRDLLRRLLVSALCLTCVVVSGWGLLGQRYGNLLSWLQASRELMSGFNEYGVFRSPPFSPAAAGAATVAVALLFAYELSLRGIRSWAKGQASVLVGLAGWTFGKSGFVRFDGHAYRYVWFLAAVACVVWGGPRPRAERASRLRLLHPTIGTAGFGAVLCLGLVLTPIPGRAEPFARPWSGPSNLARAVHPLTSEAARARISRSGTASVLDWAQLSPAQVDQLRGRRVHVDAEDIAVVWALGSQVVWTPNPVIQSYAAYTAYLDKLNADRYEDAERGADAVLYFSQPGDGHHPRFQSPGALVALFCNFQPTTPGLRFQIFTRTQTQCGPPTARQPLQGQLGRPFAWRAAQPVLADDQSIVVASFELHRRPLEKLDAAIRLRPRTWTFSLGPADGGTKYRFDPGTAESAHIVHLPTCLRNLVPQFDTRTYDEITIDQSDDAPRIPITMTLTQIPFRCSQRSVNSAP